MSDQERLRAIAEREQQATKGPWADGDAAWFRGRTNPEHGKRPITAGDSGVLANVYGSGNAKFIAHARSDVPYLLSLVERQAQEIQDLRLEIAIDNELLAERQRVLDALPCPVHGSCVPHALEEIERLKTVSSSRDALREALIETNQCLEDVASGRGGWAWEDVLQSNVNLLAETPTEDSSKEV